jgi:hypothetical protein
MPSRCWEVITSTGTPSCRAVTTPGTRFAEPAPGLAQHRDDLAGGLVEAFGHVHACRLMAHRQQPDAVRVQLDRQRVALRGRKAEQELDSLGLR